MNTFQRIGLIAGAGEIPVYFARKASQNGIKVVSVSLSDEIDTMVAPYTEKNFSIGIGQTGKIFKTLKKENVRDLVILGKVEKSLIFKPQLFDLQAIKLLTKLKTGEDKTVLANIIKAVEEDGFKVLDQRELMKEIFPGKGILTRRKPSKKEMEDIEFGLPITREMADREIGQTIVVKNKTVVAVEAVEGTDKALERGCALGNDKCVAIKVSRTDQDYRYDCPGIGPQTIETLVRGKASALALEAGRIMVIDQSRVVELADKARLSIICV